MEHDHPFRLLCDRCRSQTDLSALSFHPIDPNLLHPNYVPSKAEVSRTLELLEEETKELEQCEIDVASLRQKLEQIEARKQLLVTRIARRRTIVSTLRKLPVELWEAIFAIAIDMWPHAAFVIAPIVLTHVCSRWRDIVVRCPRLWSSITISLCPGIPSGRTKLLEIFLERSAPLPLDAQIRLEQWFSASSSVWKILPHLFARSRRLLLNIDYFVHSSRGALASFRDQEIAFNNLVFFHGKYGWELDDEVDILDDHPFWKALRQAPKLASARLEAYRPYDFLPYPQLTTLVIDTIWADDVGDLSRALEVSKNLHSLTLEGMFGMGDQLLEVFPRRVEMPSLHFLSINFETYGLHDTQVEVNDAALDLWFTSFVMPSLSTFKLGCANSHMTSWPSSLLSMLQRSSTTLLNVSLSLDGTHYDYSQGGTHLWEPLSVILETIPCLNHFELRDRVRESFDPPPSFTFPSDSILSELNYTSHKPILPDLETVSIRGIRINPDNVNRILDLAASRSPSRLSAACDVRPLRELRIVPYPKSSAFVLEPWMLEAIADLAREGVEVVIEKGTMRS